MRLTTFEEFVDLARRGTFVPVVKEIIADLLTPVSAFLKIGTILVLGVLTGFEFQISSGPIWPLILIGLAKATLILQFFMHITRVWKPE